MSDKTIDQADNYMLTRDGSDHHRLNLQYNALKATVGGKNYVVPSIDKQNIRDILDLGSGSGIWLKDMAEEFPESNLVGVDLAIPSRTEIFPENVRFMEHDFTKQLPFDNSSFDFVQMRIVPSVGKRNTIMQEIHRVLRPRGIVTFVEVGLAISSVSGEQPPSLKAFNLLVSTSPHNASEDSQDWSAAKYIEGMLRTATSTEGDLLFEDIYSESHDVPVGKWPEDPVQRSIALDMMTNQMIRTETYGPKLTQLGFTTHSELAELKKGIQADAETDTLRVVVPSVWASARRR